MRYSSIRPGNKPGDPVVTDLCWLKYTTDGKIAKSKAAGSETAGRTMDLLANCCEHLPGCCRGEV